TSALSKPQRGALLRRKVRIIPRCTRRQCPGQCVPSLMNGAAIQYWVKTFWNGVFSQLGAGNCVVCAVEDVFLFGDFTYRSWLNCAEKCLHVNLRPRWNFAGQTESYFSGQLSSKEWRRRIKS